MDETLGVEGAVSPTAETTPEASTIATGGEQQPGTQPSTQYVPYSRFQEVIGQRNADRQQLQQVAAAYQQLQGRLRELEGRGVAASIPAGHKEAAEALLQVMEAHPRLKRMLEAEQAMPHLARGFQQHEQAIQQQMTVQQQAIVSGGQQKIAELSTKAGLPADPQFSAYIEEGVRVAIERMPGGLQRFRSGDPRVVEEAFQSVVKELVTPLRGSAALASAKNRVNGLPPAPRGGPAGAPAPKPIEPGKEREFERSMHDRAMALLEKLQG